MLLVSRACGQADQAGRAGDQFPQIAAAAAIGAEQNTFSIARPAWICIGESTCGQVLTRGQGSDPLCVGSKGPQARLAFALDYDRLQSRWPEGGRSQEQKPIGTEGEVCQIQCRCKPPGSS